MRTRIAAMDDLPDIVPLYTQLFAGGAALQPGYYRAAEGDAAYPAGSIQGADTDILLAVEDGVVLGLACVAEKQTPPYDCLVPGSYAHLIDLVAGCRRL